MHMQRKLRYGMIGGGRDAFIGGVHRMAAALDGQAELVAGCFSSTAAKSKISGKDLFLEENRVYSDYSEMAREEARQSPDQALDFVIIVTPNHMHFPVAREFLKHGFNVICDKPLCHNMTEARALQREVRRSGKVFVLTHNYTGYPMVKQARDLVQSGKLGTLLKVIVEYPQGWLLQAIEQEDQKQAAWRTDPAKAGASCCVGDIGTHAENLARYITGLQIESLCADFTTFVPGRKLEDDANILVRYQGGAKGIIYASQISAGEENGPYIRVYGTKASLEWHQPEPNKLILKHPDKPAEILRPGNPYLSASAAGATRLPPGHPEGFIEAFANIYREAYQAIKDEKQCKYPRKKGYDFPTIDDGVQGMAFIEATVKSAAAKQKWTRFKT